MPNPPLSLVPQAMHIHYWNIKGHRIVKIDFLQPTPFGETKALHLQPFGEALIYPVDPPQNKAGLTAHVVGIAELCNWLDARGFSEDQQGEISIGVCEAYIRSLFPDVDYSTPYNNG